MASLRTRTVSSSSISTAGADNPEAPSLVKGQENPVEPGPPLRGARVLGDIGNRLKKHLGSGQALPGKPMLPMKATVKPTVGASRAPGFAVPRVPKATLPNRQENARQPQLTRSASMNLVSHINLNKKPNVTGTKVLGSLQQRSQSQISLKDGILKSFNANTIGDKKLPSATIVYEEKENSKPKAVVEVIPTESSSSTSTTAEIQIFEAPTNKVFEELKQDKTDNKEKSVEDNNNKVDVFSGQRFENFDIDSVDEKISH